MRKQLDATPLCNEIARVHPAQSPFAQLDRIGMFHRAHSSNSDRPHIPRGICVRAMRNWLTHNSRRVSKRPVR